MTLRLCIAYTGETFLLDPISVASTDALRTWIHNEVSIPAERQILITAKGRSVRTQTLATADEIFVYDRRYLNDPKPEDFPRVPAPPAWKVDNPPDTLRDQDSLDSWKELYRARRAWAIDIANRCMPIYKEICELNSQTQVVNRSTAVALENLKIHVGVAEGKFQKLQVWAKDVIQEQQETIRGWSPALENLQSIRSPKDFAFLRQGEFAKTSTGTLLDYARVDRVRDAAPKLPSISEQFAKHVEEISTSLNNVAADTETLIRTTQPQSVRSAKELNEDIETITRKVDSDYAHVLTLPKTSKTLSSISRMAFNHTSNLLPSLMTLSQELSDVLSNAIRQRNNASPAAATIMQRVSKIQSRLAGVQSDMERLDVAGEVFDTVYEVFEVPSVYGGLLLEAIRRQEWTERLERQAAASKEHLDNLRSQEHRRRKKWLRSMQGFVTAAHEEPPEVSFSINDPNTWPSVSREDFQAYIDELKSRDSMGETVEDLLSLYKEYTSSTERIGGDEALRLGESASKALPDSDQIRTMKDENTKLADKLRSSESRIRKLEDLLHRQSEKSRPNSAQLDSLMRTNSLSQLGSQSRQSQASSPLKQTSGNQLFDENISAQRAATLEANLLAEKEVTARLQKELSSRDDQEKQASTYKSRIAALEAELQNERATISQLRRDFADERKTNADQIQDAIDIKKDLMGNIQAQQREFENERKELEGEIKSLTAKLEEAEDQLDVRDNERLDFEFQTGLLKEKLKDVQHDLEEELHVLTMRETELDELTKEMDHTRDELKTSEAARIGLVQNLEKWYKVLTAGNDSLNTSSLEHEMSVAVGAAASKITELQRQNDELTRRYASLAEECSQLRNERFDLSQKLEAVTSDSQSRNEQSAILREKDIQANAVSEKLYATLDRLSQMLEQLGFVVVRQGQEGEPFLQRASRLNGAREGASIIAPDDGDMGHAPQVVPALSGREYVAWAITEGRERSVGSYHCFMQSVQRFPLSSFAEAITKRMKDIEAVARKWQSQARTYREKYHRAQSEAHNKIAYRGFKEGDLALFLPTRNQAMRSWAAFNVGAPHYFLRETEAHRLSTRDWLLARISKVEECVVDLSKSLKKRDDGVSTSAQPSDRQSIMSVGGDSAASNVADDDNPFELADGLRWYYLDAQEERPGSVGAPTTPGPGKSTVASANIDAKGSIRLKKSGRGLESVGEIRESGPAARTVPSQEQTLHEEGFSENAQGERRTRGEDGTASAARENNNIDNLARENTNEQVFSSGITFGKSWSPPLASSTPLQRRVSVPTTGAAAAVRGARRRSSTRGQRSWTKLWSWDYQSGNLHPER